METFFKEIKVAFLMTLICIVAGYFLLVFVKIIPNKYIQQNIVLSAEELKTEGDTPFLYTNGCFLDNFSDADALAVAYNNKTHNPFYNALYCFNYYIGNHGASRGVEALYQTVTNLEHNMKYYDHSHEWHGYQVWLKPILLIYDISDIRFICFFFTQFLFIIVCIELYKYFKNYWNILPFFISYEFFCFSIESMSFLFCMDIVTMLLSCIAIIYSYRKNLSEKYFCYIFTLTGISAAYFSMFTMPIITIGFPIIVYISLLNTNEVKTKQLYSFFQYFFYWLFGYFVMGLSKIFITIMLFNATKGISGIKWYTGFTLNVSLSERVEKVIYYVTNFNNYSEFKFYFLLLIFVFILFKIVIKDVRKKKKVIISITQVLPYFIISILPILWVFIVAVHVPERTMFLFSISIFSVLQFLWNFHKKVYK